MAKLQSLAATLAASVLLFIPATAAAAPVTVNVRVEGATGTVFEGPVTTDAHMVDGGDGTGQHPCDGTNMGANPTPGPTQTGAMDDAAHANGFSWEGGWDEFGSGYSDFFIHRIGSQSDDPSNNYWYLVRNWTGLQTGGCQQEVQNGDDLLFALTGDASDPFGTWPLLELRGTPATAATGQSFSVHVYQHDGSGAPATDAAGATVGGQTTGSDGTASISFDAPGRKTLKAERPKTIRSNAQTVCVYVPGSGDCGTEKAPDNSQPTTTTDQPASPAPAPVAKDTIAPVIHVTSPAAGKDYPIGPRVLSGGVDEAGGIAQVFLRLRATDGGNLTSASRCRWFSGKRGVFTHRTVPCSKARFFRIGTSAKISYLLPARLRHGKYVLDVKVLDRAYNAGRASVPFGVR